MTWNWIFGTKSIQDVNLCGVTLKLHLCHLVYTRNAHIAHSASGQITHITHVSKRMSFTLDLWQNSYRVRCKCWSLIAPLESFHEIYSPVAIDPRRHFSLPAASTHYWISPICRTTSSCSFRHAYRVTVSPTFPFYSISASLRPGRGALARNINLRGSGNSLLDLARRSLRPK